MKNKNLVLLIALFVGIVVGGGLAWSMTPVKKISHVLPPQVIKQPALVQLNANVTGTITEINKDYLILQTKNGPIKLFNEPNGLTHFTDYKTKTEIPYEDVKPNTLVTGGVSIIMNESETVGLTGKRVVGDILAHTFTIL